MAAAIAGRGVGARVSRLSVASRAAFAGGAVLLALTLAVRFTDSATRSANPDGPRSSSLSTGATGAAAFRELLESYDVSTRTQRGPIESLDPATTLIVIDGQDPGADELPELRRFVDAGGRLVTAGEAGWMASLSPTPLPARAVTSGDGITTASVGTEQFRVRTNDGYRFDGGGFVRAFPLGEGEVRQAADGSAFSNQRLAAAENAAFALSVVGLDRTVVFAEGVHGYGQRTGLAAIPSRWRVALYGGSLAALLTLLAAGRRIGPPEARSRDLPPARLEYVDAMGSLLRRTGKADEALGPLRERLRAAAASGQMSLSEQEHRALDGPLDAAGVLALGQLLARAPARTIDGATDAGGAT